MISIAKKIVALALILFLVAGCAASGGAPDPSSTMSDADRTKAEGTAFGALLGGLVGAAAGAVLAKNDRGKGAAVGAAVGAIGGSAAGYLYGKNAAERKALYADEESRLDGEINVLKNYNADLDKQNLASFKKIQQLQQRVHDLNSQSATLRKKAQLSASERRELEKSLENNDKNISTYNQELSSLQEYRQELGGQDVQSQPQIARLEREIDLLRENINTLDTNNKQMARLAENLSVSK